MAFKIEQREQEQRAIKIEHGGCGMNVATLSTVQELTPVTGEKGIGPDEDFMAFVAQGLKTFGPGCRLTLHRYGHRVSFVFAPNPAWVRPSVRPAQLQAPLKSRGRKR